MQQSGFAALRTTPGAGHHRPRAHRDPRAGAARPRLLRAHRRRRRRAARAGGRRPPSGRRRRDRLGVRRHGRHAVATARRTSAGRSCTAVRAAGSSTCRGAASDPAGTPTMFRRAKLMLDPDLLAAAAGATSRGPRADDGRRNPALRRRPAAADRDVGRPLPRRTLSTDWHGGRRIDRCAQKTGGRARRRRRGGRLPPVHGVHPHDARPQPLRRPQGPAALVRPDAAARGAPAVATASAGVRNVSTGSSGPGISSRATRIVGATSVNTVGARNHPRSGSRAGLVQRRAPSSSAAVARATARSRRCGGAHRAEVGVVVQRVADAQPGQPLPQQLAELVRDRLGHQHPLVVAERLDDPVDRLVQRGVVVDDLREPSGRLAGDRAARHEPRRVPAEGGRAGDGDRVDVAVEHPAGHDVQHAVGQPRLGRGLREHQRAQRRVRIGDEHDRVAARQRGRDPRGRRRAARPRRARPPHPPAAGRARSRRTPACPPSRRTSAGARRRRTGRRGPVGRAARRPGPPARPARRARSATTCARRNSSRARRAGSVPQSTCARRAAATARSTSAAAGRGDLGEPLARGRVRARSAGRRPPTYRPSTNGE